MFFGMFGTSIFFILPLIFIVVIARAASGFFRGVSRRSFREFPRGFGLPGRIADLDDEGRPSGNGATQGRLFKLALKLKGRLTVSDIVIETGLPVDQAESLIQSLVDNVHVRMEVDDRGLVTYEFPEIIRRLEG